MKSVTMRHLVGSGLKPVQALLMAAILAVSIGFSGSITAEAKKKAAAAADPSAQADTEIKKVLDPLNEQLSKLMIKLQSRALLSPEEAGKLVDLKYKLLDLLGQYPQNALLAKPLFQAATLFAQREAYEDAYEMFNNLVQGYATSPYGLKAKGQLQQMDKKFGAGYFAEAALPATTSGTPANGAANASTPKK